MSLKVVTIIALFVFAVTGAVVLALLEGGVEYRTVSQLKSPAYEGERVKVMGQVLDISSQFKPTLFTCVDIPPEGQPVPTGAPVLTVRYDGDDVPQNLQRAAHVTLEGRYDPETRVFHATLIQTQCPSRYEGQELVPAELALQP
jgi:cytochrome c-type biogenesis protein CcmE